MADQQRASISLLRLGEDVLVQQVLGHLQLQNLQALRNSGCKQLRGWVDGAPEAVWEAAALNTVAPYHPMLRCGSVRGYLAWQAEGDAAHAAGRSWPPSSTCIVPRQVAGAIRAVMSHDSKLLATYLRAEGRIELKQLQMGTTFSLQLPERHKACGMPSFSSDSTAVALLLCCAHSPQIVVIKTASAALHMLQVPGIVYTLDKYDADLTWAGSVDKLCLRVRPHLLSQDCGFWVWDENLNLIAQSPSGFGHVSWNSSGTGLLVGRLGLLPPHVHRWCLLPEQHGEAACLSEPMPESCSKLRWGVWLPGSGEVVLAMPGTLTCWSVCRETKGWTPLGNLLTPMHHNIQFMSWTASLRHVALKTLAGVRIYVLPAAWTTAFPGA